MELQPPAVAVADVTHDYIGAVYLHPPRADTNPH
jgi:hypothetical protein